MLILIIQETIITYTNVADFQKELTDQIVSLHYPDILKYCELNDRREIIIKSLDICLENCQLVSNHPYLLIDHYMPKNLTFKQLPEKLVETRNLMFSKI